jgi:Spy/CpxP family protein refolding chaperone
MTRTPALIFLMLVTAIAVIAQPPPGGPGGGGPGHRWDRDKGPPPPHMEGNRGAPPGRWWTDPALVQRLGLTADQQKKIDDLFQQSRLKLIDLNASLQKEEALLEPLLAADRPEESKVLVQIDRIAQARAELEKANARMLLGFRGVLTHEQWQKLQSEGPGPPRDHRH